MQDNDVFRWTVESFQLAVDYVYNGIHENEWPSDDYIERGRSVVNSQLAIGGYRLADLLKEVSPYFF